MFKHNKDKLDDEREFSRLEVEALESEIYTDGGYGWVICAAAALVQFIILGIHNSFGILYTYLMNDLNVNPADTAWVGSVAFGMNFLFGPVTSALCERFGCRLVGCVGALFAALGLLLTSYANNLYVIAFTYSVLWGIGSSLNYAPTMIILGKYFKKHLAMANGLVTAGSGIGTIAMGPFYHYILSTLGWRILLRILSCIALLIFVAALSYRPIRSRNKASNVKEEKSKWFDWVVWKNKAFLFWVISTSLLFVGYFVPFIHFPNHAYNLGISGNKSSLLIGYLSVSSTISRVLFGLFLTHPRINRFYVLQVCFLMMAVTTTLCPLATDYTGLILYAVSFGMFDGCFVLLLAVTTSDIVGPNKLAHALGSLYGVIAIPMIFGPPLAGFIFEISGTYENAFFLAGGAMFLGTCSLSFIPFFMHEPAFEEVMVSDVESSTAASTADSTQNFLEAGRIHQWQYTRPIHYTTRRFVVELGAQSVSSLAIGRFGDAYGAEIVERVTDV